MRPASALHRALDFVGAVALHLSDVGITRTAASLSFTTLLGVVPLATVALVSVARFPVFEQWVNVLEGFLLKHLLPGTAYAVVHEHLTTFIENAASLTGVSILFVVVTALMATATVEREINLIWGIRQRRPLGRRLIVYALGLTAGPVLIGATISVLTTLLTQSVAAVSFRAMLNDHGVRPVPIAIITLGLTVLYGVVPARRVPWKFAAAGGFSAAVALDLAKEAFAYYIAGMPTYQVVYGALAVLPVFLLWIYLCWIIILAGAAITATLTERAGLGDPHGPGRGARAVPPSRSAR